MRPPSEEVIKKYFPTVDVRRGWFGRFLFDDRATGLKGSLSKRRLRITARNRAVERAAHLSMAGLFWEVYSDVDIESDLAQDAINLTRFKLTWKLRDFWSPEIAKCRNEKYISRTRLIWHLEDLGLRSVTRKLFGSYIIRFDSGRRIDFGMHVEFQPTDLLPGEDPEQFITIVGEVTRLADVVRAEARVRKLTGLRARFNRHAWRGLRAIHLRFR